MDLEKLTTDQALKLAKSANWRKDDRSVPATVYVGNAVDMVEGKLSDIAELEVSKFHGKEYAFHVDSVVDTEKFQVYHSKNYDAALTFRTAEEAIEKEKYNKGLERIRSYLERR